MWFIKEADKSPRLETSQYRCRQSCDTLPICDPVPDSAVRLILRVQKLYNNFGTHAGNSENYITTIS